MVSKHKIKYLTAIFVAALVYAMLCGRLCAYAAINANEAELLAIIDSQREYNGVLYQVSPDYRASARAYLDDPSVDVTAEQKREAINQMFSSIQQGINDGYLIPVYQEASAVDPAAAAGNLGSVIEGIESSAQLSAQDAAGQVQSAAAATAPETEAQAETTAAETTEPQTEPAETEASETAGDAASETETEAETVTETLPPETEPSPIVLALEAAMSMDTHEEDEEPEYEELIPAYEYPEHMIMGAVGLGALLCVAGIGVSAGTGLFSHHHRRKRRADG